MLSEVDELPQPDKDEDGDHFEVEALSEPERPPEGNGEDERVLCIDLRRRRGLHDTDLRLDQKCVLFRVIQKSTRCHDRQVDSMVERIFTFLEEDAHMYEDEYLCETSLLMAALLGCNTNVSALGGTVQATSALFYLIGYLSKNPVTPNAWKTCVAAALQSAQHNGSVAEDKGSATRNAKFILQKVLNYLNAYSEVSDTQMSMLLLNYDSYKSSHRFAFCFPAPALETQAAILISEKPAKTDTAVPDKGKDDGERPKEDSKGVTSDAVCDSDDQSDSPDIPDVRPKGRIIFRNEDNIAIALSQDDLYGYRVHNWDATLHGSEGMSDLTWWCVSGRGCNDPGWRRYQREKGLHDFNLMEYVRHIEIVKMTENQRKQLPTTGPCQYYYFANDCPIKDSHIQKLHPKHRMVALSGKPPKSPGKCPRRRRKESEKKFEKRMLTWRLQADLYGGTMGAILVPWDRHNDCNVHTYEDFEEVLKEWEEDVETLLTDRKWRDWIFRDRYENGMDGFPDPRFFPDPRPAARLMLARNLGVNLRVSQKMRKIATHWRYQHSDRFEDCDEYDRSHGGGSTKNSKVDADNALAIAALIETMKRNKSDISGLDKESSNHIRDLEEQVYSLFPGRKHDQHDQDPIAMPKSRLDPEWYTKHRATDIVWAKNTLRELLKRKPPDDGVDIVNDDGDPNNAEDGDDDLFEGLSHDQEDALRHTLECFDNNEPLRMFVHGGPGTRKSFLAKRIMIAARRRGLVSRFTALSGAAATVNDGTTIHYITGLNPFCSWGREPDPNCVKTITERSRGRE